MASTTTTTGKEELLLAQRKHPSHDHPLQLLDSTIDSSIPPSCRLCHRKISTTAQAYTCKELCQTDFYYHRLCVEAPPQIDLHPLHPAHPLPLLHDRKYFRCDACNQGVHQRDSSFRCHECDFDLELITLSLHTHPLTSFTRRHDFVVDSDCYICNGSVEEDGYMCLRCPCEFVIHKECIRDLNYADGTKAPRIYHGHPLKTFVEQNMGSRTCASCGSDKSGEFICCETCQVFYHRNCFQVPEIHQYPSHHPDHTLVLFLGTCTQQQCQSCSISLEKEIYYRCTSCEFFVHVGCVFKVLSYCEEGTMEKIELSWHKHPLRLYHLSKYASFDCNYCGHQSIGPTYVCEENDCVFLLHKRCTETVSTIACPHHPDHLLTLCERAIDYDNYNNYCCKACGGEVSDGLIFSCKRCLVDLHVKCAHRFPTQKHYLHEHELLRLEMHWNFECNRCGTSNDSPLFRCVACNFNLHEECMKLPQVIKNVKIHWHPLTLHETFVEDDTGEYYCEHCEKTRDPRLGAYVCGYCEISLPRIYHIHCVMPELGKLYEKKRLSSGFKELKDRIAEKEEEVQTIEEKLKEETKKLTQKLDKARRELDEHMNQHNKILQDD